ncbi:precorrin-2 dehydrogenase/sirohydrochlorin ferrochelatase family protein [Paenibacillus sp. Z6-24]
MSDIIPYVPVMLDCRNQHCLIVGGGKVAERKARNLLQGGAIITLISPQLTLELQEQAQSDRIRWIARDYERGDVSCGAESSENGKRRYFLVHAATTQTEINRQVADEARCEGIPVNVADHHEASTFINPMVIRRGRLIASVTTSGAGPVVGRRLAGELDRHFGQEYETYIEFLYYLRHRIKEMIQDHEQRRHLLEQASDLSILEEIRQGRFVWWDESRIEQWIAQHRGEIT